MNKKKHSGIQSGDDNSDDDSLNNLSGCEVCSDVIKGAPEFLEEKKENKVGEFMQSIIMKHSIKSKN